MDDFLIKHIHWINRGLTALYVVLFFWNTYDAFQAYEAGDYATSSLCAFYAGMLLATAFYFVTLISQINTLSKLRREKMQLMMDNFDLAEEIMILKMPELAKNKNE